MNVFTETVHGVVHRK